MKVAQQTTKNLASVFAPLQIPFMCDDDRAKALLLKRPPVENDTERGEALGEILTEALEIANALESIVFSATTSEACSEKEKGRSM